MPNDLSAQAIPSAKHAQTSFDVLPPIRNRWSPRAFLDKPVPAQSLRTLLEAARWAASCFNEQPWRYIVATRDNREEFEKLLSVLAEKNQAWARAAPVLMLSIASRTFAHNGKPNRHYLHDVGAAGATLAIQAASMGLAAHAMAGFDMAKARTLLQIPDDFEPGAAIAIGYPGPAQSVPPEQQAGESAPRSRKPLTDLAFTTTFGTPFSL